LPLAHALNALDNDGLTGRNPGIHHNRALLALDDSDRLALSATLPHYPQIGTVAAPLHRNLRDNRVMFAVEVHGHSETHARAKPVVFIAHKRARNEATA
jgi:hypothetical protein